MVVWLLKLLVVSLNIRSTHKSLARKASSRGSDASIAKATPRKKRLKGELTNWIVWVAYLMVERLADSLISWIPLYGTFKAFVLLMLLLSRGAGSKIVFDKLIKPTVKPWEGTFDFVGFVLSEVLEITIYCLLVAPKWAAKKWRGKKAEPDVPSILRGLRQQHPTPRMAESLAQSLERSQGNSDKINERLSNPVTIRLNPVQASQQPRRPPPASSVKPQTVLRPLLPPTSLPPATFSSAPFRPVKTASTRTSAPPSGFRPVASTSRLPIPSSRPSAPSLYPSLESLPPAPTHSFDPLPTAKTAPSHQAPIQPTPPKFNPIPPSQPIISTPPARRSARKSRTSNETAASPHRSPAGPPIVPPTPAPPGAFNLSTFAPASPLPPNEAEEMQVDNDQPESHSSTPRRRSTRKETKRSIGNVDEAESEVETPKKKKLKSSPVVERGSTAKEKGEARAREDEVEPSKVSAATPRQKALGAISKLTADLLDEEDGEGLGGGLSSAKKGKGKAGSVLARSSSTAKRTVVPAVATRSRRGASKEVEEDEEALPKKRNVARAVTAEEEEEEPKKPLRKTTATRTSTTISKPAPRTRTARTVVPPPTASTSTSRRSTTVSRTTSRATSPNVEVAAPSKPTAPKRKARRVLRTTDGAGDFQEEVEVEGVAVVAGRRKR